MTEIKPPAARIESLSRDALEGFAADLCATEASLRARVAEMSELLSSARAIAQRRGEGTAWERFDASIAALGVSAVTPRTYRVLHSDLNP